MDTTPHQPDSASTAEDEWLLSPAPAEVAPTDPRPVRSRKNLVAAGGLVAAGLVAGAVGTLVLGHTSGSTTSFRPVNGTFQQGPGGTTQQGPGGTTQQGQQGPGGFGGFGGGPGDGRGGVAGEQHVQGTITGISGSRVTVRAGSGSATYTVGSSTQVLRNGQPATVSQLQAGDPVEVHVITSNGSTYVERVIAGTGGFSPGGLGGPGGPGGPDGSET